MTQDRTPGQPQPRTPDDVVLSVVVEILETEGYDAVQLREVARRARMSLATIYKRYATRDELIVAALERWMQHHRYAGLDRLAAGVAGQPVYAAMMRLYRALFEPWEQHPHMLQALHRARTGPGGERLWDQGTAVVTPIAEAILARTDPGFRADFDVVMTTLIFGLVGRFVQGEIDSTEILPILDRAVHRLVRSADLPADPGELPGDSTGTTVIHAHRHP